MATAHLGTLSSFNPMEEPITSVCRAMPTTNTQGMQQRRQRTNLVQQDSSDSESEEYFIFKLSAPTTSPIEVTVEVEGKPLTMELDTGAAVSIVSDVTRRIFPDVKLRKSKIILKTYTDQKMTVIGQLNVHVKYGTQSAPLILVIVNGNGLSLFGRNWLKYI